MGAFSVMVEYLNNLGVFGYLAYLLLIILLYFLFEYLLKEYVKRLQREDLRKALAAVFSVLVTVLLYFVSAPFAGDAAALITVLLLAFAVITFLVVLVMKLMGVDALSFFQK